MGKEILSTSDLQLLINDVRKHAMAVQKQAMIAEINALPFGKRLKIAIKIIFKQ